MNVLSLFDGMSCGQIALNRAGIKYDQYFASEIDKHAKIVTQKNYPETIQLGDVRDVKGENLPPIGLLIGGSPCQGFSFAGKQLAFDDPRSALFFEFVRIKNETNPKYWMLENVKMKREHEQVITRYLGIDPIEINSNLVSAQNRRRLFWTNIESIPYGLFGDMECGIPQPADKGILLRDILETKVESKYYLSDKLAKYVSGEKRLKKKFTAIDGDKALTVLANYFNSTNGTYCIDSNGRQSEEKTGTITSAYHKGTELYGSRPFIAESGTIRRLTPVEVERLQTVPDGYTEGVSDTQRYRMLGNGWTIDVIAHIFSFIK